MSVKLCIFFPVVSSLFFAVVVVFSKKTLNFSSQKENKMSSCTVSSQMAKSKFEKKICVFPSRRDVLYFLLNTFLTIKACCKQFCYCQHKKRCIICHIKRDFHGIQYVLYDNMFDLHFLAWIHADLYDYLEELFESERCVCLISHNKYYYV